MEGAPPLMPPVSACGPQHDAAAGQLLLHEVGEAVLGGTVKKLMMMT